MLPSGVDVNSVAPVVGDVGVADGDHRVRLREVDRWTGGALFTSSQLCKSDYYLSKISLVFVSDQHPNKT